jgi:hypothetical protein
LDHADFGVKGIWIASDSEALNAFPHVDIQGIFPVGAIALDVL